MEQTINQQRLKQSHFLRNTNPLQYVRKIQIENIEEALYLCLVQLRRSKVQILQHLNREFTKKDQVELHLLHIQKIKQKQKNLLQFERLQSQRAKERANQFVLCNQQESKKALSNHKQLREKFSILQQKQKKMEIELEQKQKEVQSVKGFVGKITKDIQKIQKKIQKGQPQTFQQQRNMYLSKIQQLEQKLEQKQYHQSSKVQNLQIKLNLLKQQNKELKNKYNEARFNKEMQFGISIQYEQESQISEKIKQIREDAKVKQSIKAQLIPFIEKGIQFQEQNQILKQFLKITEERESVTSKRN